MKTKFNILRMLFEIVIGVLVIVAVYYFSYQHNMDSIQVECVQNVVDCTVLTLHFDGTLSIAQLSDVAIPTIKDGIVTGWEADKSAIQSYLKSVRVKNIDASVVFKDSKFFIQEAVKGLDFNIKQAASVVFTCINNDVYDIDLSDFLIDIDSNSEAVAKAFNKVSWFNMFSIEYTSGFKITRKMLSSCVTESSLNLDDLDYTKLAEEVANSYSDSEGGIVFTPTNKLSAIQVPIVTAKQTVNIEAEAEQLREIIAKHKSIKDRVPEMSGFAPDLSNYIEVSIDKQHIWHYVNNTLCCEANCVTGKNDGQHETPIGVYFVSERTSGRYLVGDGYRQWVNQWMRITNDGIGLHDATWRGNFGGTIWKTSGSHGCINLPPAFASQLYNQISYGYTVIIY